MKLYTEEQVKEAMRLAILTYDSTGDIFQQLTPIELPSDDEIKSYSDRYSTMHEDVSDKLGKYLVCAIHTDGAKWMKEQLKNQNSQTYDGVQAKRFIKDEFDQTYNQNK